VQGWDADFCGALKQFYTLRDFHHHSLLSDTLTSFFRKEKRNERQAQQRCALLSYQLVHCKTMSRENDVRIEVVAKTFSRYQKDIAAAKEEVKMKQISLKHKC
jgi:hypothetical protein